MRAFAFLSFLLMVGGCPQSPPTVDPPPTEPQGYYSDTYSDDSMWLCRPGMEDDFCQTDLGQIEVSADGSEQSVPFVRAEDPGVDCFYVYPTVVVTDEGLDPDVLDPTLKLDPLLSQGAPLSRHCTVYAPLYEQVTLFAQDRESYYPIAYEDVLDAFRHFLDQHSQGRPFILAGHSQGSYLLGELLAEFIEPDPALHDRLVSAVLLGANVMVPSGEVVGGSFARTPLCTEGGQTGCVMSLVSYSVEAPPDEDASFGRDADGFEVGCTDPQVLMGRAGYLSGSWVPTQVRNPFFSTIDNPYEGYDAEFVLLREMFEGACVRRGEFQYYEIAPLPAEGDVRLVPPYRLPIAETIGFGTHLFDWNIPLEDLLDAVGAQVAAWGE